MSITIIQAIIVTLIPLSQLYGRIVWLNGSLDKWWTLIPIFWFPPFSIVPAGLMYTGMMEPGKGGKPYNMFMLIPIIAKFVLAFFIPRILRLFTKHPSNSLTFFISFFLQLIMTMIPNLSNRMEACDSFTVNSFGKAFVDGSIANAVGELLPILMRFVPFMGIFVRVLSMIPVIGGMMDSVGYGGTAILLNMINTIDIASYCASDFLGENKAQTGAFVILTIITLFIKMIK